MTATAPISHNTAKAQAVEAAGIRFAYRRFGCPSALPLVMLQHFQRAQAAALPIWAPRLRHDLRRLHRGQTVSVRHAVGTVPRAAASIALSSPQDRDRLLGDLLTDALGLVEEHQTLETHPPAARTAAR